MHYLLLYWSLNNVTPLCVEVVVFLQLALWKWSIWGSSRVATGRAPTVGQDTGKVLKRLCQSYLKNWKVSVVFSSWRCIWLRLVLVGSLNLSCSSKVWWETFRFFVSKTPFKRYQLIWGARQFSFEEMVNHILVIYIIFS